MRKATGPQPRLRDGRVERRAQNSEVRATKEQVCLLSARVTWQGSFAACVLTV